MEGRNISIWGKPAAEDFRLVLLWFRWKRLAIVISGFVIILGFVTFYIANVRPRDPSNDTRFITYILLAVLPIGIAGQSYFMIRRGAKKLANLAQGSQYRFDEDGVETGLTASGRMNWERYVKIVETSNDFVFFPQENIFYPVPKRFFESEGQIVELRSLIAERLGSKAKLKN